MRNIVDNAANRITFFGPLERSKRLTQEGPRSDHLAGCVSSHHAWRFTVAQKWRWPVAILETTKNCGRSRGKKDQGQSKEIDDPLPRIQPHDAWPCW